MIDLKINSKHSIQKTSLRELYKMNLSLLLMGLSSGTHARTCILLRMCLSESAVPQSSVSGMVTVLSLIRNPLKLLRASDTAPAALSRTTTNASVCMMGRGGVTVMTCVHDGGRGGDSDEMYVCTLIPLNPFCSSSCIGYQMSGWFPTGSNALGQSSVSGYIRDPLPAARIIAWNSDIFFQQVGIVSITNE